MENEGFRYFMKDFYSDEIIEIPGDGIRRVSLQRVGDYKHYLEASHGGHLQINNYMLKFWRPIIKSVPFNIWTSIAMRAFGKKEESWPSRKMIALECGVTPETVDTHFKTLEKYYLAWKVMVKRVDGQNESNIYKIRKNIPLLNDKLYQKLPPLIREEHDKFIRNLENDEEIVIYEYEDARSLNNAKKYLRFQPSCDE